MKKLMLYLGLAAVGLAFTLSPVRAADAKGYQVTGPVVEITASYIVVKKGEANWQIALDPATKGANVKVGDKVTVYYTITATEIEPKAPKTAKKEDK